MGGCDVEPLQPVTDPEALPFENGQPVREDKLTSSMAESLNCLRDAVSNAGGKLTVTSAWRPQSYQDHLREVVVKHPKLIQLAILEDVDECKPAPFYGAVHPEFLKHELNSNAAVVSKHTSGQAFDATWTSNVNARIDTLAAGCGLRRPKPWPKSNGGDPPHFEHKGKNMQISALSVALAAVASSASASTYAPQALGITVVADAVHEKTDEGAKVARYTYTIANNSAPLLNGFTVGSDSVKAKYPLLNDKDYIVNSDLVESPEGWQANVQQYEENTKKSIQWVPGEDKGPDFGVNPGLSVVFTMRTERAFPALVSTKAQIGLKTFKYLEAPVIDLKSIDQAAPTLSTNLYTEPAVDRPGWLKVTATHGVYDEHDPYPEVLLSKIDSNQAISDRDIDAVFDAETTVFYVKQAKGRTYTVTFKALDASGNTAPSKTTIDAGK